MIKRIALVFFAVAGLGGHASATEVAPEVDVVEASASRGRAPIRTHRVRAPSRKTVAVLPPARPDAAAPAASAEIVVVSVPDVPPPVIEGRPASAELAGAASAVLPPPRIASASIINVLPPLRPSLSPATDAAQEPATAASASDTRPATASLAARVATLPPSRPAFRPEVDPVETAALPDSAAMAQPDVPAPAAPAPTLFGSLFSSPRAATPDPVLPSPASGRAALDGLIAHHAKLNGVPEALVHRVVVRESRYNPRAVGRGGAMGLMQIKTGTARALGYDGGPAGLLDANTNLTYAVKYLAGAYRISDGDYGRAISHYARGYYYAAKRQGSVRYAATRGRRQKLRQEEAVPPGVNWTPAVIASGAADGKTGLQ
jgi:soluble lytic murein transglycosylase-like protein